MNYTSLHNHSDYSNASVQFADSINTIDRMVARAEELNMTSLALTDHECLSGTVKFIHACNKKGIKPIIGNEIYLFSEDDYNDKRENKGNTPYYHCILLALDTKGYRQLCQLSSRAWGRAFMGRGNPRRPTLYSDIEEIIKPNKGHVVASSACMAGEISKKLMNYDEDGAKERADWFIDCFGEENFFIEIQPNHYGTHQWESNELVTRFAKRNKLPMIATTDSHYIRKEELIAHSSFTKTKYSEDQEEEAIYATAYMMDGIELVEYLKEQSLKDEDIEAMFANTNKIADRVGTYDIFGNPDIPLIPKEHIKEFEVRHIFKDYYEDYPILKHYAYHENEQVRYFFYKIENGFSEKVINNKNRDGKFDIYFTRLIEELEEEKKISDALGTEMTCYYSTAQEIINLMWECGSLVGTSRGSAGDAFIAYLLDIVQMCPVELGIEYSFWRHASVERGAETADIDIDGEASKKYFVIEAIKKYFGEDHAINVATFNTLQPKAAIKRACKGCGVEDADAEFLSSLVPIERGAARPLSVCFGNTKDKIVELITTCEQFPNVKEIALRLEGLIVAKGSHAAGILITNKPYLEIMSHMKNFGSGREYLVSSLDLWDAEECSAIKFDMLTISALDKMHRAMDYMIEHNVIENKRTLKETFYHYFHPDNIDHDTKEMWETIGIVPEVFQFSTDISAPILSYAKPNSVKELSACNNLLRLMTDGEKPIDRYVRYENREEFLKDCEKYFLTEEEIAIVEKICASAHNLMDSQEKLMLMCMELGMDLKGANKGRKAIAKKDKQLQEDFKKTLFETAKANGFRDEFITYLWNEQFSLSLGYSFG